MMLPRVFSGPTSMAWLLLMGLPDSPHAQEVRCDLVNSSTTINGLPAKQCLDINALKGTTLVIPSNVTRLDNDGFALCRKSVIQGGDADIVFIVDQSNSMGLVRAYISPTNDTSYFFGTVGCGGGTTSGTVTVPTLEGPVIVPRLVSNNGCSQNSGDPLRARGVSVKTALDNIAGIAPGSTAGYIAFSSNILTSVSLLPLTPSNITTLKNSIVNSTVSSPNYTPPLQTAVGWLNNPSLTKTSNHAIIIISDGRPNNSNYLSLVNRTTPVYGIFLAKTTTSDTASLKKLSDTTGGLFYRVPPDRPDSLAGVIKTFITRILQDYDPDLVTVSNRTIVPAQTSTADASQFQDQGNASWQMTLDSAVGLLPNASNTIRVIAQFREINTGASQSDTSQFILSTTGPGVPGTTTINSSLVAQCYAPTELRWLNAGGFRPAFFTEVDTSVRLQLRGPKNGLDSVKSLLSTRRSGDVESSNLPRVFLGTDSARFFSTVNLRVAAAATPSSGVLQPFYSDSVIAAWVNPRDPRDFARDTLRVRPANKVSRAYFSTNNLGTDAVSQFPSSSTEAWIVIVDNRPSPGSSYTVAVSDSVNGFDHETFALTEVSPGLFSARIPLIPGSKVNNNGSLEFSPAGDQMFAVYVDPVAGYGDSAVASAGIGASVQEAATLMFTDANGIALPSGTVWPLDRGRVYLRYQDDNAVPRIGSKTVQITARSLKYGQQVTQDAEQLALADSISMTPSLKAWKGSMSVSEAMTAIPGNGTIQGAYRIEVTATVQAHDNTGQPTGQIVAAGLIIAHPDSAVSMLFIDSVNAANPEGPTNVIVTLRDQDFVRNAPDTVLATAICPSSGDSVAGLRLAQSPDSTGKYISETIVRNLQAANSADRVLSCPADSGMTISYRDAVYGTTAAWIIPETHLPVVIPAGRSFVSQVTVLLTSGTSGAQINYTVDGSLPRPNQPAFYADSLPLYSSTTLKVVASKPGYLRSRVATEIYARNATPPSRIFILDANGNPLLNKTATDAATALRILVVTSQGGMGGVNVEFRSRRRGDLETPFLGNASFDGQLHSFWNVKALRSGAPAAIPANDTLEADLPDTLIAFWRNPGDSTDAAADTVFVMPTYSVSSVYFSSSLGGPRVSQFPSGTTTVYVVDSTRFIAGYNYAVTISSTVGGTDVETAVMTQVRPGVFSVAMVVQPGGVKVSGNGVLQVTGSGDQLRAMFVHPLYGDTTYGVAGYNQAPQEIASMRFLDTLGAPLAPNAFFSPANQRIRIRYTDDWSSGINNLVNPKTLRLVLNAFRGSELLGTDVEDTLRMNYNAPTNAWEGIYPLRDRILRAHNDTVESQFRGDLRASVLSHDNAGGVDGGRAEAGLVIAYPDELASLRLADFRDNSITRSTDSVFITLKDQVFARTTGTRVVVRVACLNSGDHEDSLWLFGNGAGVYTLSTPLPKDEGTAIIANNGRLSCLQGDTLRADYIDPVYGTNAIAMASWSAPSFVKLRFASVSDSSNITSISDTAAGFLAIVETPGLKRVEKETVWVQLVTAQGERDSFPAVETGLNSGVFIVLIPFRFTTNPPIPENHLLEAQINPSAATTAVSVTGSVKRGSDTAQAVITLFSQFNPAMRGYARDLNGDGRADWVSLVFAKPMTLNRVPSSLDSLYWNSEIAADRRSSNAITLSQDGVTLQMDLTRLRKSEQFPQYLTGIPVTKPPVAKLPSGVYFGGLSVPLSDSVGPVPHTAVKLPSDLTTYSFGNQVRIQPDTLLITVSEKLSPVSWNGVFRFRRVLDCEDSASSLNSSTVLTLGEPELLNDTTYKLILNNAPNSTSLKIGDCIYLENDGRFKDVPGNRPGFLGVALRTAGSSQSPIYGMIGYPPVAGLDPIANPNVYNLANKSDPNTRSRTKLEQGNLVWVPPVDFPESWDAGDLYTPKLDTGGQDGKRTRSMPPGISSLEVLTSRPFTAHVHLYDHFGGFVKSWAQVFGYNHEMDNPNRRKENDFMAAYLVWDERDSRGQLVGSGVYIWKVTFILGDEGHRQFTFTTRTGLVR